MSSGFYFGAGNIANGGPSGGPAVRRDARVHKGWTWFDAWQDRVRRAAEAVRLQAGPSRMDSHVDMSIGHAPVIDL